MNVNNPPAPATPSGQIQAAPAQPPAVNYPVHNVAVQILGNAPPGGPQDPVIRQLF